MKCRATITTHLITVTADREHTAQPPVMAAKREVQHIGERLGHALPQRNLFFGYRHLSFASYCFSLSFSLYCSSDHPHLPT
jgi:hypothetical protein